jgi:hypothetical protein
MDYWTVRRWTSGLLDDSLRDLFEVYQVIF